MIDLLIWFPFFFCLYSQNGYPSRRRSLVDDARFETLVVKQTKQSVLEEARQRANGKSSESPRSKFNFPNLYWNINLNSS